MRFKAKTMDLIIWKTTITTACEVWCFVYITNYIIYLHNSTKINFPPIAYLPIAFMPASCLLPTSLLPTCLLSIPACLPACRLSAYCLPACLPACCLSAYCLPVCLPAYCQLASWHHQCPRSAPHHTQV